MNDRMDETELYRFVTSCVSKEDVTLIFTHARNEYLALGVDEENIVKCEAKYFLDNYPLDITQLAAVFDLTVSKIRGSHTIHDKELRASFFSRFSDGTVFKRQEYKNAIELKDGFPRRPEMAVTPIIDAENKFSFLIEEAMTDQIANCGDGFERMIAAIIENGPYSCEFNPLAILMKSVSLLSQQIDSTSKKGAFNLQDEEVISLVDVVKNHENALFEKIMESGWSPFYSYTSIYHPLDGDLSRLLAAARLRSNHARAEWLVLGRSLHGLKLDQITIDCLTTEKDGIRTCNHHDALPALLAYSLAYENVIPENLDWGKREGVAIWKAIKALDDLGIPYDLKKNSDLIHSCLNRLADTEYVDHLARIKSLKSILEHNNNYQGLRLTGALGL